MLRSPEGNQFLGIVTNTFNLSVVIDNASPAVQPSNIVWEFRNFTSVAGEIITTNTQNSFSDDRRDLMIASLTHDNEGYYTVTVSNEAGSDSLELTLNIEGRS